MPSELEIAVAARAAQAAFPGLGGYSAKVIVQAALEAAERVRARPDNEPRPYSDDGFERDS